MACTMISIDRPDLDNPSFIPYAEKSVRITTPHQEGAGSFNFHEQSFDALQFVWCDYALQQPKNIQLNIEEEVLELHFRLQGESTLYHHGHAIRMSSGKQAMFYHKGNTVEVNMLPTLHQKGSFLEIRMPAKHFNRLFRQDQLLHELFMEPARKGNCIWSGHQLSISAEMYGVISQMKNSPYQGISNGLYQEAKMTELFLLQVAQYEDFVRRGKQPLQKINRERLTFAKAYMDGHYMNNCSLSKIAGEAGLNQRSLSQGFKSLFGSTVFEYVNDKRMEEARRMLLEDKLFVSEVADRLGYKHQQHFTVAFKKKFGLLPGKLKV
ncbi:helix-turn-helix transcriptional regulator [Pedobacter sp. AW31-3R]|uniref:helix-turn-helix transcriptional regulator n=1 Tax=Pedobacter sp. AW31-3R TaxID=3445781 RepID=UPI003FA111D5